MARKASELVKALNGSTVTGEWWKTRDGIKAKAAECGIVASDDTYGLLCHIAALTPGESWPWIDPRNVTQERVIRQIRENMATA
jgi:hypothetical protein